MKYIIARDQPENAIEKARAVLNDGGLVVVPTETVYGLAADADNGKAIARIFAVKQRPGFNPLICHVSDLTMAEDYGVFSPMARRLAEEFWPGPLTLVLPLKQRAPVHPLVNAGLDSIALRCPEGIVGHIIAELGRPLAAPSANTSGKISPTKAAHVIADLGNKVDLVIDGGASAVGLESTIIKIDGNTVTLLRAGAITEKMLETVAGVSLERADSNASIEAPGMMKSHYAPRAIMRLNASGAQKGEALLGFGPWTAADKCGNRINLSAKGDLVEAASNLYDYLKQLDASGVQLIAVKPIPADGLGEAINDRLQRAAAPRKEGS